MPIRLFPWRKPRINVIEMHGLIAPRPGAVEHGNHGAADRPRLPFGARPAGDPGH